MTETTGERKGGRAEGSCSLFFAPRPQAGATAEAKRRPNGAVAKAGERLHDDLSPNQQ